MSVFWGLDARLLTCSCRLAKSGHCFHPEPVAQRGTYFRQGQVAHDRDARHHLIVLAGEGADVRLPFRLEAELGDEIEVARAVVVGEADTPGPGWPVQAMVVRPGRQTGEGAYPPLDARDGQPVGFDALDSG